MNAIAIRPAAAGDVEVLAALVGGLIAQYGLTVPVDLAAALKRHGFGKAVHFQAFLAEDGGRAVGAVLFYPVYHPSQAAPSLFMEDLFVDPGARGRGVGRALIARLAAHAHAAGYVGVEWTVERSNEAAHAYYTRLGAEPLAGKSHFRLAGATLDCFAAEAGGG